MSLRNATLTAGARARRRFARPDELPPWLFPEPADRFVTAVAGSKFGDVVFVLAPRRIRGRCGFHVVTVLVAEAAA